ncbi:MAG: STAS domain-containing protein [Planctomycetes bacterium]|jgi:anti-sigma B factor antagonist|nr:STAS domain-containing protein [Planctomycetota bacterium]
MRCDEMEVGRVLSLCPDGALDHEGAPELLARIDRALAGAQRRFLLDLSRVPTADSVGLEVLVAAARRIGEQGGRLGLCGLGETMGLVLRLTRLEGRFEILPSREQALARLRAEG